MKHVTRCNLGALLVTVSCTCAAAHAQLTAFWQRVPIHAAAIAEAPPLADMQCWDLKVTTSGNWASAGLRAVLPAAHAFFNHPLGANTKPNPALFVPFPGLEFDTYITTPLEYGGPAPPILGGFPEGQPVSMTGSVISVAWGDLVNEPPATYQIARLTFPLGVIPNVINMADVGPQPGAFSQTSQVTPDFTVEIPDIPEPKPATLLVAAAVGAVLRRRHSPGECS